MGRERGTQPAGRQELRGIRRQLADFHTALRAEGDGGPEGLSGAANLS